MGCVGFSLRRKRWWSPVVSRHGIEEERVELGVAEFVGGPATWGTLVVLAAWRGLGGAAKGSSAGVGGCDGVGEN